MQVTKLFAFIQERHQIYLKKEKGLSKPWTKDAILQQYKFCNVYRELDTVTQWIATNWRKPNQYDPNLWFALTLARYINWPDTLEEIGYPTDNWEWFLEKAIAGRKERGEKIYSAAYIISTNGRKMPKEEYLIQQVLRPLWNHRERIRNGLRAPLLQELHTELSSYNGIGSFMAAQVIADLKYTPQFSKQKTKDWWTFAASGPGSRRGLNRVSNQPVNSPWKEQAWSNRLWALQQFMDPLIADAGMPRIHAQDLQNCLCEFDKYERARLGEGRPKANYPGI